MRTSGPGREGGTDAQVMQEPLRPLTGSVRLDRASFFVLLLILGFVAAPRVVVYHSLQPLRVRVVAVTADGERIAVETPAALAQPVLKNVRATERRIRAFVATPDARRMTPVGGRLEWYLEYSRDFGRSHLVTIGPVLDDGL
jgi:hypothetical protein